MFHVSWSRYKGTGVKVGDSVQWFGVTFTVESVEWLEHKLVFGETVEQAKLVVSTNETIAPFKLELLQAGKVFVGPIE